MARSPVFNIKIGSKVLSVDSFATKDITEALTVSYSVTATIDTHKKAGVGDKMLLVRQGENVMKKHGQTET